MSLTGPGRPSAGALASPALHLELRPPPELDDDPVARRVFCELVTAASPQHFIALDVPLLTLFCRLRSQAEAATLAIGHDLANASPALLQAQQQAVKGCHD